MVRSAAKPRVSNHEATKRAIQAEQPFGILFDFSGNVASAGITDGITTIGIPTTMT